MTVIDELHANVFGYDLKTAVAAETAIADADAAPANEADDAFDPMDRLDE